MTLRADPRGSELGRWIPIPTGDPPPPSGFGNYISQRRDGATTYHHFDGVGSTRELTDSAQVVTDDATYKAFGETVAETGATPNPHQWVGEQGYYHEEATGRHLLTRRRYESAIGRFLSKDPPAPEGSDDTNRYFYAGNNPVNLLDPSGLKVGKSHGKGKRKPKPKERKPCHDPSGSTSFKDTKQLSESFLTVSWKTEIVDTGPWVVKGKIWHGSTAPPTINTLASGMATVRCAMKKTKPMKDMTDCEPYWSCQVHHGRKIYAHILMQVAKGGVPLSPGLALVNPSLKDKTYANLSEKDNRWHEVYHLDHLLEMLRRLYIDAYIPHANAIWALSCNKDDATSAVIAEEQKLYKLLFTPGDWKGYDHASERFHNDIKLHELSVFSNSSNMCEPDPDARGQCLDDPDGTFWISMTKETFKKPCNDKSYYDDLKVPAIPIVPGPMQPCCDALGKPRIPQQPPC